MAALCWLQLLPVVACLLIYEQLNSIDIAVLFAIMDDQANIRANLDIETPPIARRPGRPKGQPKAPGSGRKPGTPNRHTADVRAEAAKHSAKAIRTLVKLLGDADPKVQATAAREILDRAHGRPMQAIEATGRDGAPLNAPAMSDKELANLMAFTLQRGLNATDPEGAPARMVAHREEQMRKVSEASLRTVIIDQPKPDPAPRPMPSPSPPPDKAWAARVEMDAAPWRSADYIPSTAPTTIRHRPKG